MSFLDPRLNALPDIQKRFWPELRAVPAHFVLYGGTALALRLGHRASVDFDFFSSTAFTPQELREAVPWLEGAEALRSKPNTLCVAIRQANPVRLSFFGGLKLGRVGEPQTTRDGVARVASLLDLAATKVAVVQQRAEKKDYLDIAAILQAGVSLSQALGAAAALYAEGFNPMITLKALSYFKDGDLPELPAEVQTLLEREAANVTEIPTVSKLSQQIA